MKTKYPINRQERIARREALYIKENLGVLSRLQVDDCDYVISDVTFVIYPLLGVANGTKTYGRFTGVLKDKIIDERIKLIDAMDKLYCPSSDDLEGLLAEKLWEVPRDSSVGVYPRKELAKKLIEPIEIELRKWYESLAREQKEKKYEAGLIDSIISYFRK